MSYTKKQHTVPRSFLKNFSEDGINLYYKYVDIKDQFYSEKSKIGKVALKSATTVNDFYTLKDNINPMLVEHEFYSSKIENNYNNYYNYLINDNKLIISDTEWAEICLLTFSLYCRTPKQFENYYKTYKNLLINNNINDINHIINLEKENYKIKHITDTLTNFTNVHQFKNLKVATIIDSSEFLIGDNPLILINENKEVKEHQDQFDIDYSFLLPINNKKCLIFYNVYFKNKKQLVHSKRIERIDVTCEFTRQANLHIIRNAEKYVYGTEKFLNVFFSFNILK